jgi:ribosomal protection tetracycline resistance protein
LFIRKDIRNIGIFAHVDAGKTTLTENLLYKAGCIKKLGRVDEGTAHTDSMEVERERGISVQAASASIVWKDVRINIIDTPGHVDFSAEVERSLLALDGAILVVSAMEGVQSQTEIIWKALEDMRIPTIIFINKIDRAGADVDKVMRQIQIMTGNKGIAIQKVEGLEREARVIELKYMCNEEKYKTCEALSEICEDMLEAMINEADITDRYIEECTAKLTKTFKISPILYGSALKGLGVEEILEAIIKYLPPPSIENSKEPSGIVYKIHHGRVGGKAAYVRMYEGFIQIRKNIYNSTKDAEDKVTSIFKFNGSQFEPAQHLEAGEIGIVCGLNSTSVGDELGSKKVVKRQRKIASPMLTVKVYPERREKLDELVAVMRILEEEDPLLNVQWLDYERELHVQLMGMVQMEILTRIIKNRFNIDVIFEKPTVVYKETPASEGVGYLEMTTPYLATLKMKVEPLPPGSGYIYESVFSTDFIFSRFQNEIEQTVPLVLKEGVLGWEVTDVKVTLIGGRSINLATKPSDFRAVTPIAVMDALKAAGTILLEPIQQYEVNIRCDEAGVVIKDLVEMRASMDDQLVEGDRFIIKGIVPAATSMGYSLKIASLSQGKSSFKTKFVGYRECPLEYGKVKPRRTVDPSDREKYILSISDKNKRDSAASNNR